MNRDKIINEIVNDRYYKTYCFRCLGKCDLANELYQYIILEILEMPEDRLIKIYRGNIKGYITRMIYLSSYFKNSPFYPHFNREEDLTTEEIKRYLHGLKKIDKKNYLLDEMIFIGTNSINDGPIIKTKLWFERRKDKIESFNKSIIVFSSTCILIVYHMMN